MRLPLGVVEFLAHLARFFSSDLQRHSAGSTTVRSRPPTEHLPNREIRSKLPKLNVAGSRPVAPHLVRFYDRSHAALQKLPKARYPCLMTRCQANGAAEPATVQMIFIDLRQLLGELRAKVITQGAESSIRKSPNAFVHGNDPIAGADASTARLSDLDPPPSSDAGAIRFRSAGCAWLLAIAAQRRQIALHVFRRTSGEPSGKRLQPRWLTIVGDAGDSVSIADVRACTSNTPTHAPYRARMPCAPQSARRHRLRNVTALVAWLAAGVAAIVSVVRRGKPKGL